MKKIYSLLCLLFVLTFANQSYASHAMGGEISYVCLGGNQYKVTLDFYRDCAGIPPPATMAINFANSCGYVVNAVYLNPLPSSPQLITYVCPTELTTCNGGSYLGIQKYTYEGIITLPGPCSDWVLSHSENARNYSITTITGGGVDDLFIYSIINNTSGFCNTSPQFEMQQQSQACVGQGDCLSFSAFDPDGDSLYYELVEPRKDLTTPVTYVNGFNYLQPLLSNPPATFNNATGQFCFNAQQADVTVMAIKISEFRNGVLIGTTVRDFQLNIITCNNSNPYVSGLNYSPFTNSAIVCAGVETCFSISTGDAEAGDNTRLFLLSAYPRLTYTQTYGYRDSAVICILPLPEDTAFSPIRVIARVEDDNCPYFGASTKEFTFNIVNDASCLTSITQTDLNSFQAYLWDGRLLTIDLESQPENTELFVFDLAGKAVFRSQVNDRTIG